MAGHSRMKQGNDRRRRSRVHNGHNLVAICKNTLSSISKYVINAEGNALRVRVKAVTVVWRFANICTRVLPIL